jgi:N-acyl-D-aspartate/D-glutamate deacylase
MRNEAGQLLESVRETIDVGRATGVRVRISHLKAMGRDNWGKVTAALALIDEARGEGIDVRADQYPYTRGSTILEQLLSGGALSGTGPYGAMSAEDLLVAGAGPRVEWVGKTVAELATLWRTDTIDACTRMVAEVGRDCIIIQNTLSEDDLRTVMGHSDVLIGSDGVPLGERPHPRLHHTFPRVLGEYVRTQGTLSLSDAVHRLTGLSARHFGLKGRGVVTAGSSADIVVFDPATIADTGTYEDPTSAPRGVTHVLVNGRFVVRSASPTSERPGEVIRRGRASNSRGRPSRQ